MTHCLVFIKILRFELILIKARNHNVLKFCFNSSPKIFLTSLTSLCSLFRACYNYFNVLFFQLTLEREYSLYFLENKRRYHNIFLQPSINIRSGSAYTIPCKRIIIVCLIIHILQIISITHSLLIAFCV